VCWRMNSSLVKTSLYAVYSPRSLKLRDSCIEALRLFCIEKWSHIVNVHCTVAVSCVFIIPLSRHFPVPKLVYMHWSSVCCITLISLCYVKHHMFVILYFWFKLTWLSLSGELQYICAYWCSTMCYTSNLSLVRTLETSHFFTNVRCYGCWRLKSSKLKMLAISRERDDHRLLTICPAEIYSLYIVS